MKQAKFKNEMMKLLVSVFFILSFITASYGQKTVADLNPDHAKALEEFLAKNKDHQFLSENKIDADYLKVMRKDMGKSFSPYYRTADFNHDKILDFALILSRKGEPTDQGKDFSEGHRFLYKLTIIVFNGQENSGFSQAFIENIEAPLVCFLNLTDEEKKKLYFGIYETDEAFKIIPNDKGYVVEYFDES